MYEINENDSQKMSDNLVKRNKAQIQSKSKDVPDKATVTYDFPCYMRGPEEKKPFKKMIWDADTKEIFGRSGKSWG